MTRATLGEFLHLVKSWGKVAHDRTAWAIARRQSCSVFHCPGRHSALYADGRFGRRGDQNRGARRRRYITRYQRAAWASEHLFRDQQSRREERHAEPEVAGSA